MALCLCPLHELVRCALAGTTIAGGLAIYLPSRKTASLAWCEDESWRYHDGSTEHRGVTSTGSYRSLALIVVAIKPKKGWKKHAVVWCDSVPPDVFSALHIQLALTPAHQLQ